VRECQAARTDREASAWRESDVRDFGQDAMESTRAANEEIAYKHHGNPSVKRRGQTLQQSRPCSLFGTSYHLLELIDSQL
jgi:hypothetical protein